MSGNARSIHRATPLRTRRLALALFAAVVGILIAGHLFTQRRVYRVSVRPGEVAYVDVEVPMQRFGRSKSFAKERGLPVTCTISDGGRDDVGIQISVIETSHTVHRLRAKLRIRAAPNAKARSVRRSIQFTIDREAGWPRATLVVAVR